MEIYAVFFMFLAFGFPFLCILLALILSVLEELAYSEGLKKVLKVEID